MAFCYITEQGGYLRKQGESVVLCKDSEKIFEMPVKDIDTLVVFGNVQISNQLMLAMLDNGTDISLMSGNGNFRGRVVSSKSKNCEIRMKQLEKSIDPQYCLETAINIVTAKLKNAKKFLRKYHNSLYSELCFEGFGKLDELIAKAESAMEIEELLGYEGNAARIYFEAFRQCLKNPMDFCGRKYFPSPDPVNALLSFGYSFVSREFNSLIEAAGLDPYIGFLHKIKYGRASLSLDMMEPFRPVLVDALVAAMTNKGYLTEQDFHNEEKGGLYLNRESTKIFVRHYEEYCNRENITYRENEGYSYRTVFRKEVENIRAALNNNKVYKPYTAD
jgi:CRISP-associated protein Cas1